MLRFFVVGFLGIAVVAVGVCAAIGSWAWWILVAVLAVLCVVAAADLIQRRHAVLRNYPLLGHLRYLLESLRPELQQYFIERNFDGRPFDRDVRTMIYERAKGIHGERPSAPNATWTVPDTNTSRIRSRRSRNRGTRIACGSADRIACDRIPCRC